MAVSAQERARRLGWRVTNITATRAELEIYDQIGDDGWGGGVTAEAVRAALKPLGDRPLDIRIHSNGGDVFDGLAIYNAIKEYRGETVAYVDGLAASAASFIAMAADTIKIAATASMMIHPPIGGWLIFGTAADFEDGIAGAERFKALLASQTENIAGIYAARAGGTTAEWVAAMEKNGIDGTWYLGQEAVDAGLADELTTSSATSAPPRRAAARMPETGRIAAALVVRDDTPIDSDPVIDLGEALRAARLEPRAPSLLQLLEQHQTEPLTAAFGKGA